MAEPIVPAPPITRKWELRTISLNYASFTEMSFSNNGAVRPINGKMLSCMFFSLIYVFIYLISWNFIQFE